MENGFLRQQFEISKQLVEVMERDFDTHYRSVQLMTDTCESLLKKLEERDALIADLRQQLNEARHV
jgi:predicted nucleic acid-binding protein